ncbi:S1/P1 nuclease [Pseudaminobacter sp. 19-2017]|uniref:S1/P1 nuclease n=2 Tax=Pseudaminobacter soli (ex Zhang et al. 2022) TaxID=2831468 RepID=A0A942E078_9HYPH|nr:S1/P1 nuclease [Pseudaminobacter soli]MBS3650422.1 S1/P1 nuclease [Pseudaminobacter soli]
MNCHALAWGTIGHQVVGAIAERHLTSAARERIAAILATEGKKSLVQVANWADHVRRLTIPVQPSHVVLMPFGAKEYVPDRDCPEKQCVVAAIGANIRALSDPKLPDPAKMVALKYLVHFVGDIHQPLHTIRASRLHKAWDTDIIRQQNAKWKRLAGRVDAEESDPRERASIADWAWESHQLAKEIVRDAKHLRREDGSYALNVVYYQANWPIVERRLKAAGMRLAWALNDIFAPSEEASTSESTEALTE